MTSLFDGVLISFVPTIVIVQIAGLGLIVVSYLILHRHVKHP